MRAVEVIMKKRGSLLNPEGSELTREELEFLVGGYVRGEIPDYQISSWAMAVYFNGMTFAETAALTDIMLHSGDTIDLEEVRKATGYTLPFVDKHSTGGVGDKMSLPLAPIVAACGVKIPMMSGRALGHTGGTLDKLESIKGYKVGLTPETFRDIIIKTGYAMTGQTKQIVPADRLLYALRDVTGTVESIPLITASILSKKVAEGSDALVFDVKYGSGAFMKTKDAATDLANSLVKTAQAMGKKASALITCMETPLGYKIGNFLELEETYDILQGKGPEDTTELTYALGAEMLILAGLAKTREEGVELCKKAVSSGKAMELFLENIRLQGGDPDAFVKACADGSGRTPFVRSIKAKQDGWLVIDAFKAGLAGVALGVGRNRTEEKVSGGAGFILKKRQGDYVKYGEEIMQVYGKDDACFADALPQLESSVSYSPTQPEKPELIYKTIR
ncbi:MAG: thymidine phosphorylase [Treponema sp.]|nr:thymidine phosphorylase [Candidatus Treponema caballi]